MDNYYKAKLQQGEEFQDYIMKNLVQFGIIIMPYSTKKYQYEQGESVTHHEIKFDTGYNNTGNLYIETHERKNSTSEFKESGILKNDNTIFFITGDEKKVFLFHKKILKHLIKVNSYKQYNGNTSKAILLPVEIGYKYATVIDIENKKIL